MKISLNMHYNDLSERYLFSEVSCRVRQFQSLHPHKKLLRLGIGDVTLPLTASITSAMQLACCEQSLKSGFHGYGPENGYEFLRVSVVSLYRERGVILSPDEIFISGGAKDDLGNLTELFGDSPVYLPDPAYPAYRDVNLLRGAEIIDMDAGAESDFLPMPQSGFGTGIYYLCSPSNPTGAVFSEKQLRTWVDFANRTGSLLLFDAAYRAFIHSPVPHSVFEIAGARTCALEVCSFSKSAGFTGTRCGYTVIPKELGCGDMLLHRMWQRRQAAKSNGVAYVVQRGAEAALSPAGRKECRENIAYYMENAGLIHALLQKHRIPHSGGTDSPYIWMQCPDGLASWELFDLLLNRIQVIGTPGAGFGRRGEGYFRLSAFGSHEDTVEAVRRMDTLFSK